MPSNTAHHPALNASWSVAETLARAFRRRWIRHRWRRLREKWSSAAEMSPGAPSEITSSGARSPRAARSARNSSQASVDSAAVGPRPTNTGLLHVSIPQAASTGSAGAPGCILKCGAFKEQVVKVHVFQRTGPPGLELGPDLLADPGDRGPRQGGLGSERLGKSRLDVAVGQPPHPSGDHEGLQGVGPGHPRAEQLRAERLGRCPAAWGAASRSGPSSS